MRYQVQHPYFSRCDGQTFGPWVEGDEAELSAEVAEWVNRDSPGTLVPVVEKPAPKPAEAAKDRQQRGGRGR